MKTWQVQEAKARFSEVVERTYTEGPQAVARHGKTRAVIISIKEYEDLVAHKPSFKAHLLGGPKVPSFSIKRSQDKGRDILL